MPNGNRAEDIYCDIWKPKRDIKTLYYQWLCALNTSKGASRLGSEKNPDKIPKNIVRSGVRPAASRIPDDTWCMLNLGSKMLFKDPRHDSTSIRNLFILKYYRWVRSNLLDCSVWETVSEVHIVMGTWFAFIIFPCVASIQHWLCLDRLPSIPQNLRTFGDF